MTYGSKRVRYGRARDRRRRLAVVLLVLAVVALMLAVVLPILFRTTTDVVRRAAYPLRYEEAIRDLSREHGLEPTLVAAVVYAESRFEPNAESHQGAYGLMQLMPQTAAFVSERSGIRGNYRNPEVNLALGTWYLGYLEGQYMGDERLMLAAYNSGEGQVNSWISDEGFDIGRDIPFRETREYVENVLAAQDTYEDLYGKNLYRDSD